MKKPKTSLMVLLRRGLMILARYDTLNDKRCNYLHRSDYLCGASSSAYTALRQRYSLTPLILLRGGLK